MEIVDYRDKYAAATSAFMTSFEALFGREGATLTDLFCDKQPVNGLTLVAPFLGAGSPVEKWIGSKRFQALRAHAKSYPVEKWTRNVKVDALLVRHDSTGAIGRRISQEMARVRDYFEKPLFDLLYNNPDGFDDVPLISSAHPFGPGGTTQSNSTASALSHASFRAGIAAMQSFAMENGEPLEMSPTHLLVGTDLEATALEVAGIDRPVGMTAAGSTDQTASNIGVTTIRNVYEGRVSVIVSPRVRAGCWYLMDLSKPGIRPLVLGEARPPTPIPLDDEKAHSRFYHDDWVGSVEADAAMGPGLWPCIYGKAA